MLAPQSLFWGSIAGLSIICHLHIAHNITLFALREHCLYFFWDHFNYQGKKKERLCKEGRGEGGANMVYYGRCANGECPFQKKKDFLF